MGRPELPPDLFARAARQAAAAREIAWQFEPHPRQWEILRAPERHLVAFCGRRFGKTMIATRWITEEAIRTQGVTWWVAPTYQASMRAWRDLLKYLPRQYRRIFKADRRIELVAGGSIEFKSADNPDALRGEGLAAAVLDEAAYIQDAVWDDVISPMFLTTQGRILAITTPRARYGWAWEEFQAGETGQPGYRSWNLPTSDNPYVPEEEIERLRQRLPETTFRREILAQAVDALNNPLAAAKDVATAHPLTERPGGRVVMGIDWGRANDFTVFDLGWAAPDGILTEIAYDRFTGLRYNAQLDRFRDFCARWRPDEILAEDNNMGGPLVEMLIDEGYPITPFHTSVATKEPLIRQFQLAIEQRAVTLLDDPVLTREAVEYEEEVGATTTLFSAPNRQHDDTVIARALMVRAAQGAPGGPRVEMFEGSPERYRVPSGVGPTGPQRSWVQRLLGRGGRHA